MTNNYDAVARFYDRLSRLVFGKNLVLAQRFLVENIKSNSKVLIVGGGTGWILEEIAAVQSTSLKITYVEISAKMVALSQKRNYGQNEVEFVNQPIENVQLAEDFDLVLTPFLFDNFSETRIRNVFDQLHKALKLNGLWLLADFQVQENYQSIWQKTLLQMMYLFFGLLCGVETKKLILMQPYFGRKKYNLLSEKTFFKGFISSKIYQKR